MDKFKKLLEKKSSGKELDPTFKAAKMSTLQALRKEMADLMSEDLKNPKAVKKVEVAASDKEGLEEGLDKAKQLLETHSEEDESEGDESSEEHSPFGEEAAEEEHAEHEGGLSEDEMTELERLLAKHKASKMRG